MYDVTFVQVGATSRRRTTLTSPASLDESISASASAMDLLKGKTADMFDSIGSAVFGSRRLSNEIQLNLIVNGFKTSDEAATAGKSLMNYLQHNDGFASDLSSTSSTATVSNVKNYVVTDNSVSSMIQKYKFSCDINDVNKLYWSVDATTATVTAMMLHQGPGTLTTDWIAMGLVASDVSSMVTSPYNRVWLYRPSNPSTDYYYSRKQ